MELGWSFCNLVLLHNARNNQAFVVVLVQLHVICTVQHILAPFDSLQINETYEMQEATYS